MHRFCHITPAFDLRVTVRHTDSSILDIALIIGCECRHELDANARSNRHEQLSLVGQRHVAQCVVDPPGGQPLDQRLPFAARVDAQRNMIDTRCATTFLRRKRRARNVNHRVTIEVQPIAVHAERRSGPGVETNNLIEKATGTVDIIGNDGGVVEMHGSCLYEGAMSYFVAPGRS
ncbi:hypothetical protein BCEP27_30122 [Burkholderia cepacia]